METPYKEHISQRIQMKIKMTNSNKRQMYNFRGAMITAVVVAVLAAGCDLFAPPPLELLIACTHNGAEHLPGNHQTLPHGTDCKCKNIPGTVVNAIPVTNRENLSSASFNTAVTAVDNAFTVLTDYGHAAVIPIVKNNIKEIRIIHLDVGPAAVFTPEGGKYIATVREGVPADNIAIAFYNFVNENPQLTAAVQQEQTKNIVRLAMHGKHGNKPAFDFDFRTNTGTTPTEIEAI
jgi:hypothetical protein